MILGNINRVSTTRPRLDGRRATSTHSIIEVEEAGEDYPAANYFVKSIILLHVGRRTLIPPVVRQCKCWKMGEKMLTYVVTARASLLQTMMPKSLLL